MFFFRSSVSRCNILRNQRIQTLNEASFVTVDECLISYIMNNDKSDIATLQPQKYRTQRY